MKNTIDEQQHHILYKQSQRGALGYVWDDTTESLPTSYHQKITALQRRGVPAITTYSKIQSDKWFGRIQ